MAFLPLAPTPHPVSCFSWEKLILVPGDPWPPQGTEAFVWADGFYLWNVTARPDPSPGGRALEDEGSKNSDVFLPTPRPGPLWPPDPMPLAVLEEVVRQTMSEGNVSSLCWSLGWKGAGLFMGHRAEMMGFAEEGLGWGGGSAPCQHPPPQACPILPTAPCPCCL